MKVNELRKNPKGLSTAELVERENELKTKNYSTYDSNFKLLGNRRYSTHS